MNKQGGAFPYIFWIGVGFCLGFGLGYYLFVL